MTPEEERAMRQELDDLRREKAQREEMMREALDDLGRQMAPLAAKLEASPSWDIPVYDPGWEEGFEFGLCQGSMEVLEELLGENDGQAKG